MADNHEGWVGQNLEDIIAVIQVDTKLNQETEEPHPVEMPLQEEKVLPPEEVK